MRPSVLRLLLLCLFAGLVVLAGCRSRSEEAHAQPVPRRTVAPAPAPEPATDGGAVLMPAARQRLLIREDSLWARALRIHYNAIVMDGHIDTPSLMDERGYDLAERHRSAEGNVDLPRMFEGGLDAAFFSIYISPAYGEGDRAAQRARTLIAEVKRQVARNADSIALAASAADVRRITRSGRKAALMGLEGGTGLAGSTAVLRELYDAGVRYVTLTHIHSHAWADASQDAPRWGGLNDAGVRMVREMNRIGMLVDLSHVSDSTFYDALRVSRAPVICSHSSMRALSANVRNIDDAMLRALARNGGVVMINFFDPMVNPHLGPDFWADVEQRVPPAERYNLWDIVAGMQRARGLEGATVEDVVNHIDHAVKVAGIDHVGLGSDFDGVFDLPAGLQDCTRLPWITYGLLRRGYSEADLYKLLGGNTLRVLEEAQRAAQKPGSTARGR